MKEKQAALRSGFWKLPSKSSVVAQPQFLCQPLGSRDKSPPDLLVDLLFNSTPRCRAVDSQSINIFIIQCFNSIVHLQQGVLISERHGFCQCCSTPRQESFAHFMGWPPIYRTQQGPSRVILKEQITTA